MKFGLRYCNTGRYVDPARAVELVQAAEETGFESAWTVEHVVIPRGYQTAYPYAADGRIPGGEGDFPIPDPLIWMAYVAARSTRIRVATGILILPQRNPVITAKEVATLDVMSGGRVLLGIGIGWLKEEFEALGVPFAERGQRTDEYIAAMRALWSDAAPTYEGRFVRFKDAFMRPKPVRGDVPIVIGGHSEAAAKRAGRLAQGFFPARGVMAELISVVRREAEAAGRDPDAIEITASMPEDAGEIPALAKLGVGRLLVPVSSAAGLKRAVQNADDLRSWRSLIEQHPD
jgi:probable F420-dependent oxidoreductase